MRSWVARLGGQVLHLTLSELDAKLDKVIAMVADTPGGCEAQYTCRISCLGSDNPSEMSAV